MGERKLAKESKESPITIQCSQIDDAKEFLELIKVLDHDEKKELSGMMRGMKAMKEIMAGSAQKLVG